MGSTMDPSGNMSGNPESFCASNSFLSLLSAMPRVKLGCLQMLPTKTFYCEKKLNGMERRKVDRSDSWLFNSELMILDGLCGPESTPLIMKAVK